MKRTEWLQETRQMRFTKAYAGWQEKRHRLWQERRKRYRSANPLKQEMQHMNNLTSRVNWMRK